MVKYHYIFGETTTLGYLLGTGDRFLLQLTIEIENPYSNNEFTYLAVDYGLILKKRGITSVSYDLDEYLLAPQEYEIAITDVQGTLYDLLYGINSGAVHKDFYANLKIKYSGTLDYVVEFSGYNVVDTMEYLPLEKLHNFTIIPSSNILNETFLYPPNYDRDKWDPGYPNNTKQPNNPLALLWSRPTGGYVKWQYYNAVELINKIFQTINPLISVDIKQNWLFYGKSNSDGTIKDNIPFTDVVLNSNWIGSVFAYQIGSIESLGDLLRKLAFEYGCMAGALSQEKAFFRQLFYWDDNEVEQIGTLCDSGYRKLYKYKKLDYVSIESTFYKLNTDDYISHYDQVGWSPMGYEPSDKNGKLGGHNGLSETIISVATHDKNVDQQGNGGNYHSNIGDEISDSGMFYEIIAVKHPEMQFSLVPSILTQQTGYLALEHFLAQYYYNVRNQSYKMQGTEFTVSGLNYDFLKGFVFEDAKYIKIMQEKDWDNEITTIGALKYEQILNTPGQVVEIPTGDSVTPLSSISMKTLPNEVKISYTQLPTGTESFNIIAIATMASGEWLEGFYIQIESGFTQNSIGGFEVYDGSGTLFTINDVIGKFNQVVKSQAVARVKKYNTGDTIYMKWIKGNVSPIVGQGSLIIKKMVKV